MHSSFKRWELKIFSPTVTFLDVQEALDTGDGPIILGGLHVVLQQKEKLVVELLIVADLLIHKLLVLSAQERKNSEKGPLEVKVGKRSLQ